MAPFALSDEPPAIYAPSPSDERSSSNAAPATESGLERGWFYGRVPIAVGAGGSGVAGIYGLELDVWPIAWLGVGVEFVRGGSTGVSLFEPVESDSFKTERIRISARTRLKPDLFFVATIAGGTARVRLNTVYCSEDCRRNPGEGYGPYNRSEFGSEASGALELGMYTRSDGFHAGFVGRIDLAGPVILLTFGPVLGFGF